MNYSTVNEATCDKTGSINYKCSVCGYSYSDVLLPVEHKTVLQNQKSAICTESGYTGDLVCMNCKQTVSQGNVLNKLGHTAPDTNGKCMRCGSQIVNPQPNPNTCKWCGKVHEGFFQKIIGFFHNIFAAIFGAKY